jgi:sigma-B regulation protein RsbU (phosphoserine phosphatase)
MLAIFSISYFELLNMSNYSRKINTELGDYASNNSQEALAKQAESYLLQLSKSQAEAYNDTLVRVQNNVSAMAGYMEYLYKNPDNFAGKKLPLSNEAAKNGLAGASIMIAENVEITPDITREMLLVSNAEYMFANIYKTNPSLYLLYLGTESGILFRYAANNAYAPDYDPRKRPWYINSIGEDGPIWSDTYVSVFDGELCTACSEAYYDADGSIAGVVAVDILLSSMISDMLDVSIGETGYAFLLDDKGRYIAHPQYGNTYAFDQAQGKYKEILERMAFGETGIQTAETGDNVYLFAYAPLRATGWSLGIAVGSDEIISDSLVMKDNIDEKTLYAGEQIDRMLGRVFFNLIILSLGIIVAVVVVSVLVSKSVTKPIINLTKGVMTVGAGNLDAKIETNLSGEFYILASSFNKMTEDLKNYIENLSRVTAEKERINSDLRIATAIQADMLPKIFPPYSGRADMYISALMYPAKEVGGDFYDFFFIDDAQTKIALVIADVSGKGVPAALFMVIAKVLIKNNKNLPPDEVLEVVNNLLCSDNNSSMFVTTYYSVLDIPTGKYTYVSAGHNPPVLYRNQRKTIEYLSLLKTPPLGIFPNKKFASQEVTFERGDALLLYTDGVTEAFNTRSEMYGTKLLLENTKKFVELSPKTTINSLYETVKTFADGEPQSDDITMLFCKYFGV